MQSNYKKAINILVLSLIVLIFGSVIIKYVGEYFIREISEPLYLEDVAGPITPSEKIKAPYFESYDHKGKLIKLSDYHSRPLVIIFWNLWSKEAFQSVGYFDDIFAENENLFEILLLNSLDGREEVSGFLSRGGYRKNTVSLDTTGEISELYGVKVFPTFFFIDKEGYLRDTYQGPMKKDDIIERMGKYMD